MAPVVLFSGRLGPGIPDATTNGAAGVVIGLSAYNRALDALSRRARSTQELSRWLRDRDYPPDDVADVVTRLTDAGLLDDSKFAHAFARSRLVDRKMSRRRVLTELSLRGVDRPVATEAVNAVFEDESVDEDAAAVSLAERKFRSLASLDPAVAKRRLLGFLLRRGYDSDVVRRAVAQVITRRND